MQNTLIFDQPVFQHHKQVYPFNTHPCCYDCRLNRGKDYLLACHRHYICRHCFLKRNYEKRYVGVCKKCRVFY